MYERFTDRSRKVMQFAQVEAALRYQDYVGSEHILLGLLKESRGVAAHVLTKLSVSLDKVCAEIPKIVQQGSAKTPGKLPLTVQAKKLNQYACEAARNLNHNYVGTEHLLLGLLKLENTIATDVLKILGVDIEIAQTEVLNLLGYPPEDNLTQIKENILSLSLADKEELVHYLMELITPK